MPTEVRLPFGIHISADWLLDIKRGDLREIDSNPWQIEIIDKIAGILAQIFKWSAQTYTTPNAVKSTFKILSQPSSESGGLESLFACDRWLMILKDRLKDAKVVPIWSENLGELAFASPIDTLVPPSPLSRVFNNQPDMNPARLLNGNVLMESAIQRAALDFLKSIEILREVSPRELETKWENGLENWWNFLPEQNEIRRTLLFELWGAVAELVYYR